MASASIDLGPFPEAPGHTEASQLDAEDALRSHRSRFVDADASLIYLDGNSLGRLPRASVERLREAVTQEWGERLIRSWNERWWDLPTVVGDRLAPLIGASPGEVLISDSTSLNLYKLAGTAVDARRGRRRIITDDLNFPSDVHVLAGIARSEGLDLEIVPSDDHVHGPVEAIESMLDPDVALLSLSSTTFKSGYTYDLGRLTAAAHAVGALVLWDLSHAVGAVDVDLGAADADLAVGCTYKYLNGGPGSPAFLYVRGELQDELVNPISAWWAHDDPFGFELSFRAATGIRRFHTGTMPMLSLVGAEVGIEIIAEVGISAIRAKSVALVAFAQECWRRRLEDRGFSWASPTDPKRRGSHAALAHPDAWRIMQALSEVGRVIPDFRAPDNLRLGLSPLTTSFVDVHTAVERLCRIVEARIHENYPAERLPVT